MKATSIAAFTMPVTYSRRPANAQLCPYIAPHAAHGDVDFREAHADICMRASRSKKHNFTVTKLRQVTPLHFI